VLARRRRVSIETRPTPLFGALNGVEVDGDTIDSVVEPGAQPFGIRPGPFRQGSTSLTEIAVVVVRGEVDLATSPQVNRALSDVLDSGTALLVADMEAVEFIDASGIGVLVEIASRAQDVGAKLVLRRPSNSVLRLLDLLQLGKLLPCENDLE
jgi:anti-sigma B factor antagonist